VNIDPKLFVATIKALNAALPELAEQAAAMAAKAKIQPHKTRMERIKYSFESLYLTIACGYAWSSSDYRTAYDVLYLACEFVTGEDGVNFAAAWDEIDAEMKRLEVPPSK
jgi:hypothetical protein